MSLHTSLIEKHFDKRLFERNIREGRITAEDLEAHLASTEDSAAYVATDEDRRIRYEASVEHDADEEVDEDDDDDEDEE